MILQSAFFNSYNDKVAVLNSVSPFVYQAINAVMIGGTVSPEEASLHPDCQLGDLVLSFNGWQDYALSDGTGLTKLGLRMPQPSLVLGALGIPGFTLYLGLPDLGQPKKGA